MRKIYLIRHGTPEPSLTKGRCIGKTDVPLCDAGREEARAVGRWLKTKGCGTNRCSDSTAISIFTSPLVGCTETAEIIREELGGTLQITTDERLSEVDCGKWEGLLFEEIRKEHPEEYTERGKRFASYTIEGGESFFDVCRRFTACVDEIRKGTKGDIVVVSHAGVIRSFLAIQLGYAAPDELMTIPQICGGVTVFSEDNDGKLSVEVVAYKP